MSNNKKCQEKRYIFILPNNWRFSNSRILHIYAKILLVQKKRN
jgi:hypothetical protein